MGSKHRTTTSIAGVAHDAQIAIDDSARKAKAAVQRIAELAQDAVTVVRGRVQVGENVAAQKLKRAAGKLEDAARPAATKRRPLHAAHR